MGTEETEETVRSARPRLGGAGTSGAPGTEGDRSAKDAIASAWLVRGNRRLPYGFGAALLREPGDVAVLERAYEAGFRYIDTSLYYGDSEVVVGRFLRGLRRDSVFLATKTDVFYPDHGGAPAGEIAKYVRSCLDRSLRRLGVDYVDLYQLHEIISVDNLAIAVEELRRLQEAGTVRYVGATTRNLDILMSALKTGWFDTILTYADFTPVRQAARSLFRAGAAAGVGMINATPLLGGGLLGGIDPRTLADRDRYDPADFEAAGQLYDVLRELGVSTLQFALQFPMLNSDIDITLTGPLNLAQFESTLDALDASVDPLAWRAWDAWNKKRGTGQT